RMKYVKEEKRAQESQQAPSALKTTKSLPPIPKGTDGDRIQPDKPTTGSSSFCPSCGKDLGWKYCPYCGKPLPN
ncbi:MAG: zinc ribbon domain-containing protein, partial [Candidatus Lokiarchaeota archaeon]|nr:zinc ribbon domain-containing protein [Candidatus Lokiarchaeota archaeon]